MHCNSKKTSRTGRPFSESSIVLFFAVLILLLPFPSAIAQHTPKRPSNPPVNTGPLSLKDMEEIVAGFKRGLLEEREVLDKVKRGVTFTSAPENLRALREKGASENIMSAIRKVALLPPPPVAEPASVRPSLPRLSRWVMAPSRT